MLGFLDRYQPTALPALLFLVWLPLFLALRARYAREFFILTAVATLGIVGGPTLLAVLLAALLLGYALIEWAARRARGQRAAFYGALALLHACYWACFLPPLRSLLYAPYGRSADAVGVFVLFSGIGLSFFRLVSYVWDRRAGRPRLGLGDYLAYMLYFPQLRHGPIERAHEFTARLRVARDHWTIRDTGIGLLRIAVALGMLALAAALRRSWVRGLPAAFQAEPTDALAQPETLNFGQLMLLIHVPAVVLYLMESSFASLQLGVSRAFGVPGSENFRFPFLAADPRDFWHRWNVTLSQWLRDYAYIPLGGNRRRKYANIMLVFIYCGLLHELQWRCVAWGVWSGVTLALYVWLRDAFGARSAGRGGWVRHAGMRVMVRVLSGLLTWHWFGIGVTIFLDPTYCGLRVLRRYAELVGNWLAG